LTALLYMLYFIAVNIFFCCHAVSAYDSKDWSYLMKLWQLSVLPILCWWRRKTMLNQSVSQSVWTLVTKKENKSNRAVGKVVKFLQDELCGWFHWITVACWIHHLVVSDRVVCKYHDNWRIISENDTLLLAALRQTIQHIDFTLTLVWCVVKGVGQLCTTAARCRLARLPEERTGGPRAGSAQYHGGHCQQARGPSVNFLHTLHQHW